MNHTKRSPVIRAGPGGGGGGQVWNQSSTSTSNSGSGSGSGSGSLYGSHTHMHTPSRTNIDQQQQQKTNKKTSIFGLIVKVLTCRSDTSHDDDLFDHDHFHVHPATTFQYSARSSLRSSGKLSHSASSTPSLASNGQQDVEELSFQDICKATGNFSASNIIGEGGFGTVYKGTLKNGTIVAVKRSKKDNYEKGTPVEFKNEILTLSKIEHINLVRFYGFIEHGDEHIILVEYVANGTLREHLDGTRGSGLEIGERLDVIIDVAHAITYLHTYTDLPIIHRDIKSSNILITDKMRAKVADFGFARISIEDPEATHISTQVKGTAGYLDPEYLSTYQLTDRSDVYSFGVLLVELVTGRLPIELSKAPSERITIKWAMQRLKQGEVVLAMDPRLKRNPGSLMVVEKVLRVARQCLAPSRQSRPSMKRCAEILWRVRKDYHEHNEVMAASNHSEQVPQMDARKNRREYFGIENSSNERFQSA